MKNYRLHLIRHGISLDNEADFLAGCGRDSELSEAGKKTLALYKEQFVYPDIQALFVSPLKRAVQTAEILYPLQKRILIAPLAETYYGELEGSPLHEVYDSRFFQRWMSSDAPYTPNKGESYAEFSARCSSALNALLEGMMKSGIYEAAAVCHSGVIAALLSMHGLPQKPADEWYADPGAGYTLSVSSGMWMRTRMAEVSAIVPAGYLEEFYK